MAKILKSNGKDGEVLVGLSVHYLDKIDPKEPVFIEFDGLPVPFFIKSLTPKGKSRLVFHFYGVDNLRDAEELVGKEMNIESLDESDSQDLDFTGWTLLDSGKELGIITGMEDIPGNLCLLLGELMIPLHEDLIISLDPEARILDMAIPEGLLELAE